MGNAGTISGTDGGFGRREGPQIVVCTLFSAVEMWQCSPGGSWGGTRALSPGLLGALGVGKSRKLWSVHWFFFKNYYKRYWGRDS